MTSYGITSLPVCDHMQRAQYIEESRASNCNTRPAMVSCCGEDTLHDSLRVMLEHSVHHVYVLNSDDVPIGVVFFVDVIRHSV